MRTYSQVYGIVFNPIEDDYVDISKENEAKDQEEEDRQGSSSFYLGACGLIIDYLL